MKSLKPATYVARAARRGGIISAAALSALALASCSAGQISQTADQVAAVDGASADTADGTIAVRDVTVLLDEKGQAALKFTAVNQDSSMKEHSLKSISVDGAPVKMAETKPLGRQCVLVGDSKAGLEQLTEPDAGCITHVETSLKNDNFAVGGVKPVTFVFDSGEITVDAAVAAPTLESGQFNREVGKGGAHEPHGEAPHGDAEKAEHK
ncbi:hypothetical protein SAMN05660282_01365 [Corynebacterium spheniscorum]|uniref:Lipoprotein LpqE n=1 Tax=Corynebacterium spheniscorum TaxID=185761 RepID=A0A1I2TDU0_9CORY|nr:hypothetical protein SAMN05660282_01365 [Corynebacterium spheniscorum]